MEKDGKMEENRIEIDEDEEIFGGEYDDSITLTISDVDEKGNEIFKIIPADTLYVKFNKDEGSITLCSTSDFDEEEVIAEIRMSAKAFENFISDVEKFIKSRKLRQAKLDQFLDEE
ncbi:MAG: hypothetical protein DRN19_03590 [Thermoplasmata archaeon]|nr:MAG: hypothetical protein DRN19_03590 [Thermoplasmata archaeon]